MAQPITTNLAKLNPRQRKYARARAKGLSKNKAAAIAGYAPTSVGTIEESENFQAVFKELVRRACPPHEIVAVIKDGLQASKVDYLRKPSGEYDEKSQPAWSDRREYAKLAAQWSGLVAEDNTPAGDVRVGIMLALGPEHVPPLDASTAKSPSEQG